MKFLKFLFLALLCVYMAPGAYGQMPDATANFVKVEKEITTTPEFPGICNPGVGIQVTINEPFLKYLWISPSGVTKEGKTVTLNETGKWKIEVKFIANNVVCYRSKELLVSDLSNPFEIRKYFVNAGFWPVPIYRGQTVNVACRNCDCDAELEPISFTNGGTYMKLTNAFEQFNHFRPFQGMDYQKNITNNSCLCNDDGTSNVAQMETELGSGELSVWGHQFFQNENILSGTLYLKASMSWESASPKGPHRNRLDAIKSQLVSSGNTAEQARKIFTNLFMNKPIGGYNLTPSCADPEGCFAEGNFLTPAGIITKLPAGAQFAFGDGTNGGPRGALLAYNDNIGNSRQAYRYKSAAFAGYYHDLTATVTSDLKTVDASPDGSNRIVLIEKGNAECFKSIVPYKANGTNPDSWGGIGYSIIQNNTIHAITPKVFESVNPGEITIAFMAPTAGIISIERNFSNIELNYTKTENATVENFAGGMLWSFDQLNHNTCEINSFVYQPDKSNYLDKKANVIYKDNHEAAEKFEYIMACNGSYYSYSLNKGNLNFHSDGSPNYDNNFDGLTDLVIPFSPQNDIAGASGVIIGDVPSCTFCPSQEFSQLIIKEKYCLHPEHIFVEKIAQLATVYPDYFKDPYPIENTLCSFAFTQREKWEKPEDTTVFNSPVVLKGDTYWPWGVYLKNNPDVAAWYNSDNVKFFKRMIAQISETRDNQINWWNDVASKTTDEIICHLRQEPQSITSTIPWDKKLIALNKLYEGNFLGILSNDLEYAVVHILVASKASDVIPHIEGKGIKYYWDNFHDFGGEDNLSRVITSICSKINEKAPKIISMEGFLDDPIAIPKLESDFFKNSNLTFDILGGNEVKINNKVYNYDDLIPIEFSGSCTFGDNVYEKGALVNMPALQAALFAHDNNKVIGEKAAWVVVDIGLLWIGIGSAKIFLTGGNYLRKISVGADIIGSTAGISVQLINNDAISPELRSQIQICAMALSLGELAVGLSKVVLKIDELHDVGKLNNLKIAKDEASELTREAIIVDNAPSNIVALTDANPNLREVWRALFSSPLRNSEEALLLSRKMLDDGFEVSHIKNIAKDCNHDIRGFEIADILGTKPITKIDAASMTRKAFQNGIDQYLEVITKNDGIYLGNDINGWEKLKKKIDAVANGEQKQAIEIGALEVNQGKKIQIENGRADLEVFIPENLKASFQMKSLDTPSRDLTKTRFQEAINQLNGTNEVPTLGHKKCIEIEIKSENNTLFNKNRNDIREEIISYNLEYLGTEKIFVKNNIERFEYDITEF